MSSTVKEKIRKVLAIASDDAASEAEVQNALKIAAEWMGRHHLSEDDLAVSPQEQTEDAQTAEQGKGTAWGTGKRMASWENSLCHVVTNTIGGIGCYVTKSSRKTPSGLVIRNERGFQTVAGCVVFYGNAEDVVLASQLYEELRLAIVALARLRYGSVLRGDGAAYSEGFVSGLRRDQTQQAHLEMSNAKAAALPGNCNALMVIERRNDLIKTKLETAKKWLESPEGGSIKLYSGSGSGGSNGSWDARNQGKEDGGKYDLSSSRRKKIGN